MDRLPGLRGGASREGLRLQRARTNIANDPGINANWIPEQSWKFFTQF